MRMCISAPPFGDRFSGQPFYQRGRWPAHWVAPAAWPEGPAVLAFRCAFTLDTAATVRIHVSADERYELFLDGVRIGRGPERGDGNNWFFETYDLALDAGPHALTAKVFRLGELAPAAQMSTRPGFLLCPDAAGYESLLATGVAPWKVAVLRGIAFHPPPPSQWFIGGQAVMQGASCDWEARLNGRGHWSPAVPVEQALDGAIGNDSDARHRLTPAVLPAMLAQPVTHAVVRYAEPLEAADDAPRPVDPARHDANLAHQFASMLDGDAVTFPPHARVRAIIDLSDYYCAWTALTAAGTPGSRVQVHWAEALFLTPAGPDKGARDTIAGKYFIGIGPEWHPGGDAPLRADSPWWHAGRYLEIRVASGPAPLTMSDFRLIETRYPLARESVFETDDTRLNNLIPILFRSLQMCAHETYMDCPYYEQLMYVGDTRLEALTTYVATPDDRLPRKAIAMFGASRIPEGLTRSRHPARVRQVIPPFSLWWIGMLHDFALWRDDLAFVRDQLPAARGVADYFLNRRNTDGLVAGPEIGWNFMDWVPGWEHGVPPDGERGVSAPLNWLLVLALGYLEALERGADEPEAAARWRRRQAELAVACHEAFYLPAEGLYADERAHRSFSEHTQCLALLSGLVPEAEQPRVAHALLNRDLTRTTIYFTHYLFETYGQLGRMDRLVERLGLWFDLPGMGLKTTLESPEPSRSDCHAWGAHPYYHYFATILGIRPASPGFKTVVIRPQLGPLRQAAGTLPHPCGPIAAAFERQGSRLAARIRLPPGLTGVLETGGELVSLSSGDTNITM